jgi:hypothetical protein
MFHVGQKVVCVDITTPSAKNYPFFNTFLKKGNIYTVRSCHQHSYEGETGPAVCVNDMRTYWAFRFKPLIERKTDISIFKKLLNPKNHKELCDNHD